jgi:glycosyltransferase involved in cell wall biosynthesis
LFITRLDLGGAQQIVLELAADLATRSEFEVFLISGPGGHLEQKAKQLLGHRAQFWPEVQHPINPATDLAALRRLRKWLQTEKIDLLHTHSSKAGWLGRYAGRALPGLKVAHTIHGFAFHDFQPFWLRALYATLERRAAAWCHRLIAVSHATAAQGLKLSIGTPEQYAVIQPGIRLEEFAPATQEEKQRLRRQQGWRENALLIGVIGNFKPQKAPTDLMRAARVVLSELPQAEFMLAGGGPALAGCRRQAARWGLVERMHFLGWQQGNVADLARACDLLALASRWEGLPIAMLQGAALGLPLVATNVGGMAEIIREGGNGVLVPPAQPRRLAQALIHCLRDSRLMAQWGKASRQVAENFSLNAMLERHRKLYSELLEE